MVGGEVTEAFIHPESQGKIYVNTKDKNAECAIYVERNILSEKIKPGDSLWWQGRKAYWTPKKNRLFAEESEKLGHKCSIDYDIPIPRIGFSGVERPVK